MLTNFLPTNTLNMTRTLLLFLPAIWIGEAFSQNSIPEIVSACGETFRGANMQIDWTLGEVSIATIQNSSHQITQGFHQPYYSIVEFPGGIAEIVVYPNPTPDRMEIGLTFDKSRKVQIRLFDNKGSLIWKINREGRQIVERASLSRLPSGNYLLHFLVGRNQFSKTFKILKID